MTITNYFAVEPIIVGHIANSIPELIEVNTPFNIDDLLNNVNGTPSVSVIYYGDRMGDVVGKGSVTSQYQQWLIVLAVRDAMAQSRNTNSIRAYANPFILKLLGCMQGFDPKTFDPDLKAYRHFKRADSPVTAGSDSGFAYFPFMFEVQMFV